MPEPADGSGPPAPPDGPSSAEENLPTARLRIYVDADVLLAGAASPVDHSASQVILSLSEITLIDAITSELAVAECIRNLEAKVPAAVATFQLLAERALAMVPPPSEDEVRRYVGSADWKDLPHLACAIDQGCPYLVTYNTSDYRPGHPAVEVLRPGLLVRRIRDRLTQL